MSGLETETLHDQATFEHFGRQWSVPTKRHLSHLRWMRDEASRRFGDWNLIVVEAMLSPEVAKSNQQKPDQFEALVELDPTEEDLDVFVGEISKAMGLGDSGNSAPSSTSS